MNADPNSILEALGPARRYAEPDSPQEARLMAARGALPLPPAQIASVLFALTFDPDPEVKDLARTSLDNLPPPLLDGALTGDVHPALLAFMAEKFHEDEGQLEKIAVNAATSDETFCLLASRPFVRIVDIVAHNQVRLLRCPRLVETLGENPVTGQATIDRILHFLGVERGELEEPLEPREDLPTPPPPADLDDFDEDELDLDDPDDLPPELTYDPDEDDEDEDEGLPDEGEEEKYRSLQSLLQGMNVMEKIKLARLGNAEARGLLVRERNKLVATAAIRSPKIKESEVVAFARSRNLHDEVIRIISQSREWTKSYPVKLALTTNPKTPPPTAIKLLNYLTDRDLKTIMRSRDVPGPVSTQARRLLSRKGKV
ncbi:MAG: hypothetical protein V3V67_00995 [Myxococcota bacterium]